MGNPRTLVSSLNLVSLAIVAGSTIGCGAESPENVDTTEWRLEEREYPYQGTHGETICAEHRRTFGDGSVEVSREFYHLEVMNRQLDEAKSPGGSKHVSDEVLQALESEGTFRVSTCDQARKFVRLIHEIAESKPTGTVGLREDDDGVLEWPPEGAEDAVPGMFASDPPVVTEDVEVDKIADGVAYSDQRVVEVKIWLNGANGGFSRCTGQVISNRALWLAAHCFPATGYYRATVRLSPTSCLTPGLCGISDYPSANTVYVYRDPGYNGAAGTDRAMVFGLSPWSPVGYIKNLWLTAGATAGTTVTFRGFGVNSHSGTGGGTERNANNWIPIDWISAYHMTTITVTGQGRICSGDSGGPAFLHNAILGDGVSAGIAANFTSIPSNPGFCPYPGDIMRHACHFASWADIHYFFTSQACYPLTAWNRWTFYSC